MTASETNGVPRTTADTHAATAMALVLLLEAFDQAEREHRELAEFAVPVSILRDLGLSGDTLQALTSCGYVLQTHAKVRSSNSSSSRRKNGCADHTCFVLTPRGAGVARQLTSLCQAAGGQIQPARSPTGTPLGRGALRPQWNAELRELRLGDILVKRFSGPAQNQEAILAAFQEEGWPTRIDDPLRPSPNVSSTRRLHDTIKNLNRHQVHCLLRFRGDGTGQGIRWESLFR
jgi:hypothetical protein